VLRTEMLAAPFFGHPILHNNKLCRIGWPKNGAASISVRSTNEPC